MSLPRSIQVRLGSQVWWEEGTQERRQVLQETRSAY